MIVCDKGGTPPGTELAVQMSKRSRDGLQGAKKSPEIGENENYYMYVHVPVKRVLGFQQILQGIFSTLQKVRNNCKGES